MTDRRLWTFLVGVVLCSGLFAALLLVVSEKSVVLYGAPLGALVLGVSFLFGRLEGRNLALVQAVEALLRKLETEPSSPDEATDSTHVNAALLDVGEKPAGSWHPTASWKTCFRWTFRVFNYLGASAATACLFAFFANTPAAYWAAGAVGAICGAIGWAVIEWMVAPLALEKR